MLLQSFLVALLVAGSFVYAAWQLMPAALRRGLARTLLRWPALARWRWLTQRLHAATQAASACGACDSCGSASSMASNSAAAVPAAPQVITFHPRRR